MIIFDVTNRIIMHVRYTGPKATREPRLDLSVYKDTNWAEEYFKEHIAVGHPTYESYVGWKSGPFKGKYINVSSEGIRNTWNPNDIDKSKAKSVYCFGGSVLWGMGARDDYTIPSFISKFLNKGNGEEQYYVVNYGQQGYSFFQEAVALLLLIKNNQIPDYVIFFDGVNDIHASFVNSRVGEAADFSAKRERYKHDIEIKSNRDYLKKFIRGYIDTRINMYEFTRKLRRKWRAWNEWNELDDEEKFKEGPVTDKDRLEQKLLTFPKDTADHYFNSIDMVRKLATIYGFKVAFFWQPMAGAHLSASEEEVKFLDMEEGRLEFNQKIYKIVEEKENQEDFYDLQKIFQSKDKNTTVYIDFAHMADLGNSIVAKKIADVINHQMRGKK